jgi:predicted permease
MFCGFAASLAEGLRPSVELLPRVSGYAARGAASNWFGSERKARGFPQGKRQSRMIPRGMELIMLDNLNKDIRFGFRSLVKRPGFSIVAVLTLALGIAATTATFTVVDTVLLRALPLTSPERLVIVHNQLPKINLPRTEVSALHFKDYSREDVFESTAAMTQRNFNLSGVGVPERLQAGRVTATFFPLLGVNPIAGRFFVSEEDRVGSEKVAVLSSTLWKRQFNSDTQILNNSIQLNGTSYQVVGVAPQALEEIYPEANLWIPMAFTERDLSEERRNSLAFTMLGRLRGGTNVVQAQSIMTGLARTIEPDGSNFNIEVRPFNEEYLGDVRKPLFVLMGAVMAVLLISCANVANLLLARASSRGHEIAVRSALGAGRARIVRQLLTESALIAVIGGALGMVFAWWGTKLLLTLAPANLPRLNSVQMDVKILLISFGVSLVCGFIFGLVPALTASRTNLVTSLKQSDRSDSAGLARQRFRRGLVVAEVAIALVLLVSSGLLIRSFSRLLDVQPGFNPQNVITLRTSLPGLQYPNATKVATFYDDVLPRIKALPGVEHAAAAYQTPFTPGGDNSIFRIRDRVANPGDPAPHADYGFVSADYFKAIGLPILKGRDFQPSDMRAGNFFAPGSVAIIDEELAKRFWPNGDALGGGISWSETGPWATVVGICATAQLKDLSEESKGTFYLPAYVSASTFVVRTSTDPRTLTQAIREQVSAVDKNQPLYDIKTMEERVGQSLEARRFAVVLLSVFSGLALVLAAIGLYGVLAFVVSQRTKEIGIHMALGAQGRTVVAMVLKEGLMLVVIGAVIGTAGAYALTHVMQSLLYETSARDPLTFVLVPVLLLIVGLLACYVPARRATRVDPLVALRNE